MATALQAQLAQIAAKSSDPLNLKAHRKAYSQSLLFEPEEAARQSLDALFEICQEGFLELCAIEPRFNPFSSTLFSEESKAQDRSQLTASQNQELDHVLESFLSLVGTRILLKPALKALEWLIRHFRVHEMNTSYVLYTFMPYHDLPHFATLLSILPRKLPQNFQFLLPYLSQRSLPPRHEIVYAAARRVSFWRDWSNHVLEVCRRGYQYHNMIAHWASVATEALVSQMEHASRGNRSSEQQKIQDIVLNVLPIINDALSMTHVPDMRISALMILTVLASDVVLTDETLSKLMEGVAQTSFQDTFDAELICMVVLAQKRTTVKLHRKVLRILTVRKDLSDDLVTLSKQYDVRPLILGLIDGAAKNKVKKLASIPADFVCSIINSRLLTDDQSQMAVSGILEATQEPELHASEEHLEWLTRILCLISEDPHSFKLLQNSLDLTGKEIHEVESSMHVLLRPPILRQEDILENKDDTALRIEVGSKILQHQLQKVPTQAMRFETFLGPEEPEAFNSLLYVLSSVEPSSEVVASFLALPMLQHVQGSRLSVLTSFFLKVLCGPHPNAVRASAIPCLAKCIQGLRESGVQDFQVLIPYLLFALADPSETVRSRAMGLVAKIDYPEGTLNRQDNGDMKPALGKDLWYCEGRDAKLAWLSPNDSQAFLREVLIPNLEECRSDKNFAAQMLNLSLGSDKPEFQSLHTSASLKLSQRENMFAFLLDHIAQSPLVSLQMRLLYITAGFEKVGHVSKSKRLTDTLLEIQARNDERLTAQCVRESVKPSDYLDAVVTTLSPNDRNGLKLLEGALEEDRADGASLFQLSLLRRLQEIWHSLKIESATGLTNLLFIRATNAAQVQNRESQTAFLEILRQLPIPQIALIVVLEQLPSLRSLADVEDTPSKRRKLDQRRMAALPGPEMSAAVKKITIALELVESSSTHTDHTILSPLFALLGDLHHMKDIDPGVSYAQTLIIDVLNNIISKTRSIDVDRQALRVDLVVENFRNSTSTQLQQASLLLMSSLAAVAPEEVIHSIMPVFTFMGSTLLRQSDEFSMRVIDKTIESIIPPLAQALQKDKRGPLAGVSELIVTFVAAFEHIAPSRRSDLFANLVDKIGPDAFLHAYLMMLIDRHGNGKEVIDFCLALAARYSPNTQMSAIDKCLEIISDSLTSKPTTAKVLFSLERYNNYEATAVAVSVLLELWTSSPLLIASIRRALRNDNSEATAIRERFAAVMNKVLSLLNQAANPSSVTSKVHSILRRLLLLFPLGESIQALDSLLQSADDELRCQALKSIEAQVSAQKTSGHASRAACLGFLERLRLLLESAASAQVKRAAISCTDRIVEKFGKADPDAVLTASKTISGPSGLSSDNTQLQTVALLCLTSMVEALEDAIVPEIPKTLPLSLKLLQEDLSRSRPEESFNSAAWTFISSLLIYVPYIITGNYLDGVLWQAFKEVGTWKRQKSSNPCERAVSLVPSQVPAKEMFSAFSRNWVAATEQGTAAVMLYISLLDSTIDKLSKPATVQHSSVITPICLQVMSLRQSTLKGSSSIPESEVADIERALYATMIKMIYKLNDKYFRPIFAQIVEWASEASEDSSKPARQTALYGFTAHFFETLKSIVTSYASFIIDGIRQSLLDMDPTEETSTLLWERITATLSAAFEHDQDEFWQAPSRFANIAPPLVAKLDLSSHPGIVESTVHCISLLAAAADSPENLRVINSAVLERFRHDNAAVRLAAVTCEQSLTDHLGEEWLSLLPEMLPFISEAMEDDDERVEIETRKWVRKIEDILGESLDPMLQ